MATTYMLVMVFATAVDVERAERFSSVFDATMKQLSPAKGGGGVFYVRLFVFVSKLIRSWNTHKVKNHFFHVTQKFFYFLFVSSEIKIHSV